MKLNERSIHIHKSMKMDITEANKVGRKKRYEVQQRLREMNACGWNLDLRFDYTQKRWVIVDRHTIGADGISPTGATMTQLWIWLDVLELGAQLGRCTTSRERLRCRF